MESAIFEARVAQEKESERTRCAGIVDAGSTRINRIVRKWTKVTSKGLCDDLKALFVEMAREMRNPPL